MQKIVISSIFIISVAIGARGILDAKAMTAASQGLAGVALNSFHWLFLLLTTGFVILGLLLAASPYGDAKLDNDDEPEFSVGSWIATLFAGGIKGICAKDPDDLAPGILASSGNLFIKHRGPSTAAEGDPGQERATPSLGRPVYGPIMIGSITRRRR